MLLSTSIQISAEPAYSIKPMITNGCIIILVIDLIVALIGPFTPFFHEIWAKLFNTTLVRMYARVVVVSMWFQKYYLGY